MKNCLLLYALGVVSIHFSAQDYQSRYESNACPEFIRRVAEDADADINCGYLIVPEDRQSLDSDRLIELFVFSLAAKQPTGDAPLILLAGGPGSPVAERLPFILRSVLHQHYEIIAIDYRGAGFSLPSLNCQELDNQSLSDQNRGLEDCYRRLVSEGVGLQAYNSANGAKDIHDLLAALNIGEANIYGISYGSRLALTLARDYPQRVRALILDGVLPPQVNRLEAHAPNGYRAMAVLFADCIADADCNRAYPNLSRSFYSTLARMNQAPAKIQKANMDYPIMLTGDDFVAELYAKLYDKQLIPFLPALIDAYAAGDYDFDAFEASATGDSPELINAEWLWEMDNLSEGLAYSFACAEEIPFNSRDRIVNLAANLPAPVRRPLVDMAIAGLTVCEAWTVPAAPEIENQPVAIEIPTLLLSGRYDPVTPPAWGEEAAMYLTKGWHYVFPDAGHGVLFESDAGCAESIALSFLAHPQRQLRDACLESLSPPDFYIRPGI